jgi:hypothetical protein
MNASSPTRKNKTGVDRSWTKASLLPLKVRLGVMKSAAVQAAVTAFQHRVEIVTPAARESIFPNQIGAGCAGIAASAAWHAECSATRGEGDPHGET